MCRTRVVGGDRNDDLELTDPNGNVLPAGDYTLALAAIPPDGSRATYRKVTFTIK